MRYRTLCSGGLFFLLASCGGNKISEPEVTVASVTLVSGGGQTDTTRASLGTTVVFQVNGSDGGPFAGATVTFSAAGGGLATPSYSVTGANGRAATTWQLGSTAGDQTLTATASGHTANATAIATTPAVILAVPTLTVSNNSTTQVDLSWNDVGSETLYRIERCAGAGCSSFTSLATTAANITAYSNTGLSAGTYRYRVRAEAGASLGNFSTPVTASTEMPTTATMTATTTNATTIALAWNNVSFETGYVLERCSGVGCSSFATIATPTMDVTTFTNTGVSSNTSYTYRIHAVNGQISGASSAPATANTNVPGTPVLSVRPTTNTANLLQWADVAGETSYEVLYCTGAACVPNTVLATPASGSTSYSHTSSTSGATYRYAVRGLNGAITGVTSNTAEVLTLNLIANGSVTVSGAAGSRQYYWFDVPAGCDSLMMWLKAGTGNPALYFGQNTYPDGTGLDGAYGSVSGGDGVSEGFTLIQPAAGRWYVMVSGTTAFSNFELYNAPVTLVNEPSFEQQGTWQLSGDAHLLTGAPRTGLSAAFLSVDAAGGPTVGNGSVSQTISVPSAAGTVTGEFYQRILTYEPDNTNAYDFLYVRIRSTTGTLLATPLTLSNTNVALNGAYSLASFDLSPWRGQTIVLSFESVNDYSYGTQFHLDDVRMKWTTKR